ncbi:MAG: hypothetical protein WDN26_00015 [Chitinophagaceae bacterium]
MHAVSNRTARYGVTTTVSVSATDLDAEALSFSLYHQPSFATLTNNGDRTATITLTPVLADAAIYDSIAVIVNDSHGGTDTARFKLTVNDNYSPVIDSIGNYTLNENESATLNLVSTDLNVSDTAIWSVNNIPASFTLTPGTNGHAQLVLNPGYASEGSYVVEVTVSDNKGGITTRTFNFTVVNRDPNTNIYTRVKYANDIGTPWNNLLGVSTNALKDENGVTTTVGVQFQNNFWMPYNAGPTTGNNSGVYPDAVLNDFWYFGYNGGPETATLKVTGLNPAKKYGLTFYAGSVFAAFQIMVLQHTQ